MTRLTDDQLAERWSVTTRTLRAWRKAGKGPAFLQLEDRSVRYRLSDVEAYEESKLTGSVPKWRGPVKRAAEALDVLAEMATKPAAVKTINKLRDELRALIN